MQPPVKAPCTDLISLLILLVQVTGPAFEAALTAGEYCMHWGKYGTKYAIRHDIRAKLAAGITVVANVSRSMIDVADERFPGVDVYTLLVTASEHTLRYAKVQPSGSHPRLSLAPLASRLAPVYGVPVCGVRCANPQAAPYGTETRISHRD